MPKLSKSRHDSDDPRVSPDTSSPPSLPPYPRRDFNSGSLSDSGLASHTTRSPLHSNLSSHNVHFSLLHARHNSPSSPNLPLAGYFSDGDRASNLLHPSRLDVKRLLSKPAAPSVNSTLSITSDSESNALRSQANSNEAWPSKTRMQVHFQPTPPMESMEQLPSSPQPSIQQRPRNLLRKRSGSKQTRASVSATLPGKGTTSSNTTRSPPASPRSEFSTTTLQFVIASRAAVPASALPQASSSKLTPAGAIVQAYKEQDLRREALAAAARSGNPSPSGSHLGVPDPPTSDAASTISNGMPYYTVIGSSPDRIVFVGSVEDKLFDAGSGAGSGSNPASTASVSQPIKSLTRKVSARFRRGRPSVSKEGGTPGDGDDAEPKHLPLSEDPSSQLERHQSASSPKFKSKFDPLRLSLDQPARNRDLAASLEVRSPRPVPSESIVVSSPVDSKGKQKLREDDTGAGGRLWKLVKRISAGGLRDRFHTTGGPVPPVPPVSIFPADFIPTRVREVKPLKPLPPKSARRKTADPKSGSTGDCSGADTHTPTSVVRPSADAHPSTSPPSDLPTTPQGPRAVSQSRLPSISSSSPHSSEPTSTHFFRSHSSRSSFSSMLCGSPPLPPISAPVQSQSPRSTRSRAKSSASLASPARPSCDGLPQTPKSRTRKRSSPDIPSFSVSNVINNFIVRRPSVVRRTSITRRQQQQHHNGSARSISMPLTGDTSTPPPRPARSELRNKGGRDENVLHPMQSPGPSVQSNDSQSSSSTERPGSTSTSTISAHAVAGTSASAGSVAQLTFREIGGTRRQAWTSQEKEDKWDDLLKKSARAGGTLHLGADGAGLASDHLRFSQSTLELDDSERTDTEI